MRKKLLSLSVLALLFVVAYLTCSTPASAKSGTLNGTATYDIDGDVLTIHGGTITGYDSSDTWPWNDRLLQSKWPWVHDTYDIKKVVFDGPVKASGDLSGMFYYFYYLEEIEGLSNLDTSDVTYMRCMFSRCARLTKLDVSHFNTSKVKDMYEMFFECGSIKELNLSGFDTSNVTDMRRMFTYCSELKELDLSSFDTSNVVNMNWMFGGCKEIRNIRIDSFDTSKVTDMGSMFGGCTNLRSLDVSGFNTENVEEMRGMFGGIGVTSLSLSNFDTTKVKSMQGMFSGIKFISRLDLSSFNTPALTETINMFSNCERLEEVNISGMSINENTNSNGMFSQCPMLSRITLGDSFKFIGYNLLPSAGNYSGRWKLEGGNTEYSVEDIGENYPSSRDGLIPGTYIWADEINKSNTYLITFKSNGCAGEERVQRLPKSRSTSLISNWFTWGGHDFTGWNTAADGSGESFDDCQSVSRDNNIVLYAQWNMDLPSGWNDNSNQISTAGGVLTTGNYYLGEDIRLTNNITIDGKVTIWLRGHVLEGTQPGSVITVSEGSELFIMDGDETITHYYKSTDGVYSLIDADEYNLQENNKGIIKGGIITGSSECGIKVDKGALHLYGGTICGFSNKGQNVDSCGIFAEGELNIYDGCICGNKGRFYAGGVILKKGVFQMSGGEICYNEGGLNYGQNLGAGVYASDGEFYMSGGKISHNHMKWGCGGGVYIWGCKMVMSGGEISDNTVENDKSAYYNLSRGGGIYGSGILVLTGGEICNNCAESGGGIYSHFYKTIMRGGRISGNTAYGEAKDTLGWGGGILDAYSGVTELRGGVIESNYASVGGGLWHSNISSLTVSDIKIINNTATDQGGGLVSDNASGDEELRISGSPVITGNIVKKDNLSNPVSSNVFLSGKYHQEDEMVPGETIINDYKAIVFQIVGDISSSAQIGVTTGDIPTKGNPVAITQFYDEYNSGINPATLFTSDSDLYKVIYDKEKSEAVLALAEDVSHIASFQIGDEVIARIPFTEGDKVLSEPKIPEKNNYVGTWEKYDLENAKSDIVIQGVYVPVDSELSNELSGEAEANYKDGVVKIRVSASAPSQTIRVASTETRPMDVVLVLDQSGSMMDTLGQQQTKRDALISCADRFVRDIYLNSVKSGAPHRVAVVGFAYDSYNGGNYGNTGLLATSNGSIKNYAKLENSDYANALLPITIGNSINDKIIKGIASIAAEGATAANLGLKMAKNIFSETAVDQDRERIVIFITDGTPTCWGETPSLITRTASDAINIANTIKNAQNAKIYCVGVEASANPDATFSDSTDGIKTDRYGQFVSYDFNRFLHAVSSDYPDAVSMSRIGDGDKTSGYYMAVNNTNGFGKIFDNILLNTVYELKTFDKATIAYRLSSDFAITMEQETALYKNVKNSLGLDGESISIIRNNDGTTDVTIKNVPVKKQTVDGILGYYAIVEFEASALNGVEGKISTGEECYVSQGDGDVPLEVATAKVDIPVDRHIIVFKINGKIYRMTDADLGDEITIPCCELATWDVPPDSYVTEGYAEFEAVDVRQYEVHWIIAESEIVHTYQVGDTIVPPGTDKTDKPEHLFIGWSPSVPSIMPPHDIICQALYTRHTHQWIEKYKTGGCETGITTHYHCASCGATKSEYTEPHKHSFTAIVSYNGDGSMTVEKVVCTDCGYSKEQNITYKIRTSLFSHVLDLSLYQAQRLIELPDHNIKMKYYIGEDNKNYRVTRIDPDGTRHQYVARAENGYLEFELDHFSIYVLGELDGVGLKETLSYSQCLNILGGGSDSGSGNGSGSGAGGSGSGGSGASGSSDGSTSSTVPSPSPTPSEAPATTPLPTQTGSPTDAPVVTPVDTSDPSPVPAEKGTIMINADGFEIVSNGDGTAKLKSFMDSGATALTVDKALCHDGYTYTITSIMNNALKDNKALKKLIIGESVKKIGAKAFYGCSKLKTIVVRSTKLTKPAAIGKQCFKKIKKKATFRLMKKNYKKTRNALIKKSGAKKPRFKVIMRH